MRATERPQGMPGSKQLSLKATKSGTKCGAYYVYCFTTAPLNPTVTAGWSPQDGSSFPMRRTARRECWRRDTLVSLEQAHHIMATVTSEAHLWPPRGFPISDRKQLHSRIPCVEALLLRRSIAEEECPGRAVKLRAGEPVRPSPRPRGQHEAGSPRSPPFGPSTSNHAISRYV